MVVERVQKEVKECNEYITVLHNEIDNSSKRFKEEVAPIIKDINKLHGLMIQANDDNRMLFGNLRTVTLFGLNMFDLITLVSEMNKVAEFGSCQESKPNAIKTIAQELGLTENINKDVKVVKNSIKLTKPECKGPFTLDSLNSKKNSKINSSYKSVKRSEKVSIEGNKSRYGNMNFLNSEVLFKNKLYRRDE